MLATHDDLGVRMKEGREIVARISSAAGPRRGVWAVVRAGTVSAGKKEEPTGMTYRKRE